MVTEETVFKDNRKVMSKFWDDYREKAKDYSSGGDRDYYGTYLKKVVDYQQGLETKYNRPDTERRYYDDVARQQQQQAQQTQTSGSTGSSGSSGTTSRVSVTTTPTVNTQRFTAQAGGGYSDNVAQQSVSASEAQRRSSSSNQSTYFSTLF